MRTILNLIISYRDFKRSLSSKIIVIVGKKYVGFLAIFFFLSVGKGLQAQVLINPAAVAGNFDGAASLAAAGWITSNAAPNAWRLGTFICGGTNAAFVGSTAGSNAYNAGINCISYLYRSIVFPAGQTCITLSFNWKGNGEANVDGMIVYIGSAGGPAPVTGNPFTATDIGAVQLNNSILAVQTPACASVTLTLPPGCAGTTRYLVFCWQNNNSVGGAAGTVLDDINLVAAASVAPGCATGFSPANLSLGINRCNPVLSWTAPAGAGCTAATSYDIYFGTATNPPLLDNTTNTSYSLPVLTAATLYYWKVVPRNAAGAATGCIENTFTTGAGGCTASPGGVGVANLTAWFKADALATGNLTSWSTSYSSLGPAITVTDPSAPYAQATNGAAASTNYFNYNQYVSFVGNATTAGNQRFLYNTTSYNLMSNSNVSTDQSSFFTTYQTSLPDPLTSNDDAIIYWQPTAANQGLQCRGFGRMAIGRGLGLSMLSSQDAGSVSNPLNLNASVFSYTGNRSSSSSMNSYYNGSKLSLILASESQGGTGLSFGIHIMNNTPTFGEPFFGGQSEHIFYNATLAPLQVNKVHSYLAVKYGTTLTTNYTASNNTIIYTTLAPYNNNIIGIGRDDNSALTQKQSHNNDDSVRFYMGALATTNVANASTFTVDQSFLLTGATTGSLFSTPSSMAAKPASIFSRIERQWKVTKTNFAQNFSMDVTLAVNASSFPVIPSDLRLLVTPTNNFSTATVYAAGGGLSFSYNGATKTITVSGISTLQIPNNSTQFITIGSANPSTPLRLQLTNFTGHCTGNKIVLDWNASADQDIQSFTIERSLDGVNFTNIESILPYDLASRKSNYSFTDNNMDEGNYYYYYRIKQINSKGAYYYTTTVQIKQNCSNNKTTVLTVYPNPVNNKNVQFTYSVNNDQLGIVKITNSVGKLCITQNVQLTKGKNSKTIMVNGLTPGIYFIKIESDKEVSQVVKFLISDKL